jgi:hypothetical protein
MSSDIQNMRERRSANEKLIFALSIGIDSDIAEIRTLLDPYEEKVQLQEDKITLIADKINNQVKQLKRLTAQNKLITKDLGE